MNISFILPIGLLVIMVISLTVGATQENNNTTTISDAITLNNTILSPSAMNNTALNATKPENVKAMNNVNINASTKLNATSSRPSNETPFVLGNSLGSNKTIYDLSTHIKSEKDASKMWYIIEGTPHGYT